MYTNGQVQGINIDICAFMNMCVYIYVYERLLSQHIARGHLNTMIRLSCQTQYTNIHIFNRCYHCCIVVYSRTHAPSL